MGEVKHYATYLTVRPFLSLASGLTFLFLASCQFAPVIPQDLKFQTTLFAPGDMDRRVGKAGFGRLQFITAHKGPHRAAIAHVGADEFSVIADYFHQSRIFLRTWKAMQNADLKFGDEFFLKTSLGDVRYERFSLADARCFHFYKALNRSMDDDFLRERTIIAGYYCNDDGVQMGMAGMAEFINGLGLNWQGSWNSVPGKDTSDLFAPQRPLFERRIGPDDLLVLELKPTPDPAFPRSSDRLPT